MPKGLVKDVKKGFDLFEQILKDEESVFLHCLGDEVHDRRVLQAVKIADHFEAKEVKWLSTAALHVNAHSFANLQGIQQMQTKEFETYHTYYEAWHAAYYMQASSHQSTRCLHDPLDPEGKGHSGS